MNYTKLFFLILSISNISLSFAGSSSDKLCFDSNVRFENYFEQKLIGESESVLTVDQVNGVALRNDRRSHFIPFSLKAGCYKITDQEFAPHMISLYDDGSQTRFSRFIANVNGNEVSFVFEETL